MSNVVQFLRTTVSGNLPNTTNSSNASYLTLGSLAFNLTDKTAFTSDGTNLIYIGANTPSQYVSIKLNIANAIQANSTSLLLSNTTALIASGSVGSNGYYLASNGSTVFWSTVSGASANTLLTTRSVRSNTNIVLTDDVLLVQNSVTITLPYANTAAGIPFQVKNLANNIINILPSGSDTIDGYNNVVIQYKNSAINLISNGSIWTLY